MHIFKQTVICRKKLCYTADTFTSIKWVARSLDVTNTGQPSYQINIRKQDVT